MPRLIGGADTDDRYGSRGAERDVVTGSGFGLPWTARLGPT